jgi:hypothetical protein
MGAVWRAHDELLGVEVALKEVTLGDHLNEAERAERVTRAMREARSAARLRSNPHVVTVHDAVEHGGLPWIVMELVASVSLHDAVMTRGPLPPAEAARVGLAMLGALSSAHALGVLHRDVKPSNILLADDGRVLLTDFGIATHEADSTLTRTGYVGTPRYMAPERLDGGPASPATDLFALGGTLYFAVEGRPPFMRDTAAATIGAIMFIQPDPPERAGPLTEVVMGLLEKRPEDRLDAVRARARLEAVAAGFLPPPVPRPAGPTVSPAGSRAAPWTASGAAGGSALDGAGAGTRRGGDVTGLDVLAGTGGTGTAVRTRERRRRLMPLIAGAAALVVLAVVVGVVALAGSGSSASAGGPGAPTAAPTQGSVAAAGNLGSGDGSDAAGAPSGGLSTPVASGGAGSGGVGSGGAATGGPGTGRAGTARAGALPVAAGFVGAWHGTVHQGTTSYEARVVLRRGAVGTVVGTSDYPTLGCRSQLRLTAATRTTLTLQEQLTRNDGVCVESAVEIDLRAAGKLRYSYAAGLLWSAGEATLSRD